MAHTLGHIHEQIGTSPLGSEAPNATSIGSIEIKFVSQHAGTGLGVITSRDLGIRSFNVVSKAFGEEGTVSEHTVVLVWGLGQNLWSLLTRALSVTHNRV